MKTCSRARFRVCKLLLLSFGSSLMKAASIVRDFCYSLNSRKKLLQIKFNGIKASLIKGVNRANRIRGLWSPFKNL